MVKSYLKEQKLKKGIMYICCCTALFFICMMPLKVQATEDDDIFSSASAKVHIAMSEDSDVAANLIVGSMFEVLGAESDANGVVWYQVRTDFGAEGYVKANELDRVLQQAQEMQQQAQQQEPAQDENDGSQGDGNAQEPENEGGEGAAGAEGDNNENPEPDGEGENDTEGDGNGEALGELIVLESVNLRRMPSTGSEILSRIDLNTRLPYFEKYTNDAEEVWYKVQYEDMTGYVTDGAVMIQQPESQPNEDLQLPSGETEPTAPTEKSVQENGADQNNQQPETESSTVENQAEFEVNEKTDVQKKHRRKGIDWMIVILVLGGALCVAAIVIFIKKILRLLRK